MKAYDSTKRHDAGCGHGCCFLEGHLGEKNKRKTRRVQKKRERTTAKDTIRIEASTEEGSHDTL